jgi:cytoskeletal protein RodZ
MKKLSPKAKKITIITGAAVVCIGVLSAILYQQHAIADSADLTAASSGTSASATSSYADITIPKIAGNNSVTSGTAGTGSAFTPSSGKSASAPLTPSVSKPTAPSKPTIQGDSKNGKQPTNGALTDKTKKPTYTTPPKAPTQKSGGTTTQKKSNGGTSNKSGGGTKGGSDPIFGNKRGSGHGEGTTANDMYEDGTKVGITD